MDTDGDGDIDFVEVTVDDGNAPIDYNCDGDFTDVDGIVAIESGDEDDQLGSHNDWAELSLIEGSISGQADAPPDEPFEMLEEEIVPPIGPGGFDYQVFGSSNSVQLRPGESRVVTMSARSVGLVDGVWTTEVIDRSLTNGVTVSAAPTATLDFTTDSEVTFAIELTAPATAAVGDAGRVVVGLTPPADNDSRGPRTASVLGQVEIIDASAPLGPAAVNDTIESPEAGVTFDPTLNDTPGDAPLDAATLSIVSGANNGGSLTLAGDGQLTYVPAINGEDQAVYEICDTNNQCSTATLTLYEPRER